jgi:sugar lactone lactonase YvrE
MLVWWGILLGAAARGQANFGSEAVGATASMTVTVRAQAAGTLGAVQVLTWGMQNGDFTATAAGTTCAPGSGYSAGQTCSVGIDFTPAFPGVRAGAVLLLGEHGGVLATQYLSGIGVGPLGVLVPGVIRTVAGNGQWTSVGDGQLATAAELFLPASVAADGAGNLYIADSVHNRIRKVEASTGVIATLAGNGDPGNAGDNGPAGAAELNDPSGVALDGAGNVYIADTGNSVIRKITAATGTIATIAGDGVEGYGGDNGAATSARLNAPAGVSVDLAGDVVVADTANHRVRLVSGSTGKITTIAGNGATTSIGGGSYSGDGGLATLAGLNFPYAVGYDLSGNMYIPDSGNNRIRMVSASTGKIETVAGSRAQGFAGDNGPATDARLYAPSGVAFDAAGNLLIADTQNNLIRKVNAITGIITTVAGNGSGRYGGDGANAESAQLYGPYSVFADALGDLFIADYFDNRVREISSGAAALSFTPATQVGSVSAPQSQLIENDGNAALDFASISADANTLVDAAASTCSVSSGLGADTTCAVAVEFAPSEAGNAVTGKVVVTETPGNATLSIGATGQALALNSTETLVASSANPAVFGQAVQLLATVTGSAGTPSGTMTFADGGIVLGAPVTLNASGSAAYSLSSPAVGLHSIVAAYAGDASHLASVSSALAQTVEETTSVTIASSQNPCPINASVTFTATAASAGGGVAPTGALVFQDGATNLGTATIDSLGRASLTVAGLAAGSHSITASYSGLPSAYILGSVSTALHQAIQGQTAVVVSPSANPSLFGQTVQLVATVTGGSGTPSGTVTFSDGGNVLGAPVQLSSLGTAVYAFSSPAVGLHAIVANYSGDTTHLASVSAVLSQSVDEATTTAVASSQNPSAPSASVTFSASVTSAGGGVAPTGAVVFLDGPGAIHLGTVNLDGQGRASLTVAGLAAGPHSITASYSGVPTAYILGSLSPGLNQTVQGQTATLLSSSANPSIFGSSVVVNANVSSNGPTPATGTVTFFDGAQQIGSATLSPSESAAPSTASFSTSALSAGIHAITAVYGGSAASSGSVSPALAQTVQAAPTEVKAGSSANPSIVLSPIALTASVAGNRGPASGVVIFLADAVPLATQTLDSRGFASISTSALGVGPHTLSANYLGDQNDAASSSSPFLQTVQVIPTVTNLGGTVGSGANPQLTLSATVAGGSGPTPTGSVVFQAGSAVLGTGTLNASGVAALTLASNTTATSIVAAYPGDLLHGASQSAAFTPPAFGGFQLNLDPESVTVPTSQNTQVTITLDPGAGFTDKIGLGCASLPALVTCYFSSDSVVLKPNGAVTAQLTIDTDSPLSGGPVASSRPSSSRPGPRGPDC